MNIVQRSQLVLPFTHFSKCTNKVSSFHFFQSIFMLLFFLVMQGAYLLMTANPPTYFFIRLDAVKVTRSVKKGKKKTSLPFHKSDTFSSSSVCPLSPTDICTVQQSIISPHLQKRALLRHCIGGSKDPYLYLIFILSQQQERWSCHLRTPVNKRAMWISSAQTTSPS